MFLRFMREVLLVDRCKIMWQVRGIKVGYRWDMLVNVRGVVVWEEVWSIEGGNRLNLE